MTKTQSGLSNSGLRWLGHAFYPGIPARHLTAEEADRYGREMLIKSGLYVPEEQEVKDDGRDKET